MGIGLPKRTHGVVRRGEYSRVRGMGTRLNVIHAAPEQFMSSTREKRPRPWRN